MAWIKRITCIKVQKLSDRNVINCDRILSGFLSRSYSNHAQESASLDDNIPDYPPVKPRYPPGVWGNISETSAWFIHERAHKQLSIPLVKERLESMAGEKNRILWLMKPVDKRPNNLAFKQFVTKTQVINGMPTDIYNNIDVESAYAKVKSLVPNLILQEHEYLHKHKLEEDINIHKVSDNNRYLTHQMLGTIIKTMMTSLLPSYDHLVKSQLDEDVRVETFWHAGGFSGEERRCKGKQMGFTSKENKDLGILLFQYKHKADWQIRTELPLPEFASLDSSICHDGLVPSVDYVPSAAGLAKIFDRPTNVSGHWIGDPCEFSLISLHTWPTQEYERYKEMGESYLRTAQVSYGLATGFGSCMSQAYNQGFTSFLELTYPLTTHSVITNGRELRFFAYQLNTMQTWNDGKTLCNILWASEPVQMFETVEHGQVKGLNEEAFKMLMKLLMVKPLDRGVSLRPYLPEEESPLNKSIYINHKGEEPLPVKKIGRFEHPPNTVYF